jgi:TPP-dependent indolepyruvate ferredoxin oxidoreductase alpha subunit
MLISVADFVESGMECMLTQFSLRKAEGGVKFEFSVPEFCIGCPHMTSTLSPLVEGGAEDTAIGAVTVAVA